MTNPAATKPAPRLIEIMRAGRQTDSQGRAVDFTAADLQAIAAAYDPQLAPAPVVVGHPSIDDPAYGWIKRLVVQGESLFAEETDVEPQFDELRRAKRFRNRSASFYLPDSPGNPKPGGMYIKHVGWLGAAAPAVKGLKPVNFSDTQEGVIEFSMSDRRWGFSSVADALRRLRERLIDTDGQDTADSVLPDYLIKDVAAAAQPDATTETATYAEPITEEPDMTSEAKARELAEREARVAAQEQALASAAAQARRSEAVAFAEGLVNSGKLLPVRKAAVVELLLALPTDAPLTFGEGAERIEKPAGELLRELLSAAPVQIDFAEKGHQDVDTQSVSFAAPPGASVDPAGLALHSRAINWQAQHPGCSYHAAVKAVGG